MTSTRQIAELRVAAHLRTVAVADDEDVARAVVAIVFAVLTEPDQAMQQAGAAELGLAVPTSARPRYIRNLAAAAWRTMLAEARR